MNFLELLKKCEPNVSQISRDSNVSRQATYLWKKGHIPSFETFARLRAMPKYRDALFHLDYNELRKAKPIGRPKGA